MDAEFLGKKNKALKVFDTVGHWKCLNSCILRENRKWGSFEVFLIFAVNFRKDCSVVRSLNFAWNVLEFSFPLVFYMFLFKCQSLNQQKLLSPA